MDGRRSRRPLRLAHARAHARGGSPARAAVLTAAAPRACPGPSAVPFTAFRTCGGACPSRPRSGPWERGWAGRGWGWGGGSGRAGVAGRRAKATWCKRAAERRYTDSATRGPPALAWLGASADQRQRQRRLGDARPPLPWPPAALYAVRRLGHAENERQCDGIRSAPMAGARAKARPARALSHESHSGACARPRSSADIRASGTTHVGLGAAPRCSVAGDAAWAWTVPET